MPIDLLISCGIFEDFDLIDTNCIIDALNLL